MVAIRETDPIMQGHKTRVGVVVFNEDSRQVLLVKHKEERKKGEVGVPAGEQRAGETLEQTAIREFNEETGLELRREDLVRIPGVYSGILKREEGDKRYNLNVFIAKDYSGELKEKAGTNPFWARVDTLSKRKKALMPSVEHIVFDGLQLVNND